MSLFLRSCSVDMPAGFEAEESAFQHLYSLMLLDALQSSKLFNTIGDCATSAETAAFMAGASEELMTDLLQILCEAGYLSHDHGK